MTKIDIYSGFLGAGKTTLIKKMIQEAYKGEQLVPIQGTPPNLAKMPEYCSFYPRCQFACEECLKKPHPGLREVEDGHFIACHLDVRGGEENA